MIKPEQISALTLDSNTADTYDREELLVSKILFFIMILRPLTIGRVMYRCLSADAVLPIVRGLIVSLITVIKIGRRDSSFL